MTNPGGKARATSLTPERRQEIAQAAAKARWGEAKPKPEPTVLIKGRVRQALYDRLAVLAEAKACSVFDLMLAPWIDDGSVSAIRTTPKPEGPKPVQRVVAPKRKRIDTPLTSAVPRALDTVQVGPTRPAPGSMLKKGKAK